MLIDFQALSADLMSKLDSYDMYRKVCGSMYVEDCVIPDPKSLRAAKDSSTKSKKLF